MEHIARSFRVTMSVKHPDMDPAEVSKTLEMTPRRATQAGAPRTTTEGDRLTGVYAFSCWAHEFDVEGASELGTVLEGLVARLRRHGEFFQRIAREGGSVELFCGVFAAGNWDEVLSCELLGQLAALHLDLRLDVYPSQNAPST